MRFYHFQVAFRRLTVGFLYILRQKPRDWRRKGRYLHGMTADSFPNPAFAMPEQNAPARLAGKAVYPALRTPTKRTQPPSATGGCISNHSL